jgi:hypothetical protein
MGWPDTGWQPTAKHERRPWWLRRWRPAASGDLPVAGSVGRRLEVGGDSVNQFGGFGRKGLTGRRLSMVACPGRRKPVALGRGSHLEAWLAGRLGEGATGRLEVRGSWLLVRLPRQK